MILDSNLELSLAQAVTAAARSTNTVDLGSAKRGAGDEPLKVVIQVDEAVTAAGAATVQFQLQCDDNSGSSSAKTVLQTDLIGKAALVIGYEVELPIPPELDERYLSVYYNVGTGPLTAGKFSAFIVRDRQTNV